MFNYSNELLALLRTRIMENGSISVAEFMTEVLCHPVYGYYSTRDPFGKSGDFITAPEISQMFGELIGLWVAATWEIMDRPKSIRLVELGPGRGTLISDAMRAIQKTMPKLFDVLKVDLIEISPALRKNQTKTLQELSVSISINWYENFKEVPVGPCLILANEFFDALPINQYQKTTRGWQERLISLDQDKNFCFTLSNLLEDDTIIPEPLRFASIGQTYEKNPMSIKIIQDICSRFQLHSGACLIVDYGHIRHGLGDTVQSVKDHRFHSYFNQLGQADITAHVDFESLSEKIRDKKCNLFGPITQKELLEKLGIWTLAEKLMANNKPCEKSRISLALNRLIGNKEMGKLFKSIAFSSPSISTLPGFK